MLTPACRSFATAAAAACAAATLLIAPIGARAQMSLAQIESAVGPEAIYLDLVGDGATFVSPTDPALSLTTDLFPGDWGWPDASDSIVSYDGDGDAVGDILDDKDTFAPDFTATLTGFESGAVVEIFVVTVIKDASYDFSWGKTPDALVTVNDLKSVGIAIAEDNGAEPDSYAVSIGFFTADPAGTIDVVLGSGIPFAGADGRTELDGLVALPPPDPEDVIFSFTATPANVLPGEMTQLRWTIAADATSAVIEPGTIDALAATTPDGTGSVEVVPVLGTTYTLSVDTPTRTGATADTHVEVALIGFFTAAPGLITAGETATLSWHVRSDAAVEIDPDPGPITTIDGMGSVEVAPVQTTMYQLTVTAPGAGEALGQVTVNVLQQGALGGVYGDPPGGWDLAYDGSIDPTTVGWNHDNGSDAWDGSAPGAPGTDPGGAGIFAEGPTTFLRLQDPGDPGDHGFGPDPTNRKIFFALGIADALTPGYQPLSEGVTLYFRARVPVPSEGLPLDPYHPDGGGATEPWAASGDGYAIHDGGKGSVGIREFSSDSIVSFALSTDLIGPGADYSAGQGLTMNSLVGTVPSADVDTTDAGFINLLPLDPTQWHDFWITVVADISGGGTHRVDVYLDGSSAPESFHVTAGTGDDGQAFDYLGMGMGATPQSGAVDVDFFALAEGVHVPVGGVLFQIESVVYSSATGEAAITWPSREGQIFALERSFDLVVWTELDDSFPAAAGLEHTTYVDNALGDDPPQVYYRVRRND